MITKTEQILLQVDFNCSRQVCCSSVYWPIIIVILAVFSYSSLYVLVIESAEQTPPMESSIARMNFIKMTVHMYVILSYLHPPWRSIQCQSIPSTKVGGAEQEMMVSPYAQVSQDKRVVLNRLHFVVRKECAHKCSVLYIMICYMESHAMILVTRKSRNAWNGK